MEGISKKYVTGSSFYKKVFDLNLFNSSSLIAPRTNPGMNGTLTLVFIISETIRDIKMFIHLKESKHL